jgi:hypothetical protein
VATLGGQSRLVPIAEGGLSFCAVERLMLAQFLGRPTWRLPHLHRPRRQVSKVGGDPAGRMLVDELEASGVDCEWVLAGGAHEQTAPP